jgi:DNA-binding CsgD family transcriptional regulator
MQEALRLFEGAPPSAEQAWAWYRYATHMGHMGRPTAEVQAALQRGLELAEAAGAAISTTRILYGLAYESFVRGEVEEGFRLLARAREEAEASRDAQAVLYLAMGESGDLLTMGKLEAATRVGLRGVDEARRGGVGGSAGAVLSLAFAVEGLLGRGRTAEAAALIDPETGGPVDRDRSFLHEARAEIDMLRGEPDAAAQRLRQIKTPSSVDFARELGQRVAEVALWAGRPEDALEEVQRQLEHPEGTDLVIFCGWLLTLGMRACADLTEQGGARRDDHAVLAALAAADDLAAWVKREHDVPFTDHPFVAAIAAERATWVAERSRAAGPSDAESWNVAAEQWEALDYRHRAGYCWWRQAEALLAMPHADRAAVSTVLSTAAGLAVEHVPLMTAIQDLARRARIDLSATEPVQPDESAATYPFGLTDRELDVLRLLGQGKTNPEIAAALFISPRTAGVHVTHILRKLDATSRVQAATVAERAGLLAADPTRPGGT